MSFFFSRSKQKGPQDLCKTLSDLLARIETPSDRKKIIDEIARTLYQIKVLICGDHESEPSPDQIASLAQSVYSLDILSPLISYLPSYDFEARRDVVLIFSVLLRRQIGTRYPTVDYLAQRRDIFEQLIIASGNPVVASTCGSILRDCAKQEALAKAILSSSRFWQFFDYVNSGPFELASDAFATIEDLLTLHYPLTREFLNSNQIKFIQKMSELMRSDNYVSKRQSLRLLSVLLRQRALFPFMQAYVSDAQNLKFIMILMRDKSKNIQYLAIEVFKLFVVSPKKSKSMISIFAKNKLKLLTFLETFQSTKKDDERFEQEKEFIIREISKYPTIPTSSNLSPDSGSASRSPSPVVNVGPTKSSGQSPNDPSSHLPRPLPNVPATTATGSNILSTTPSLPSASAVGLNGDNSFYHDAAAPAQKQTSN